MLATNVRTSGLSKPLTKYGHNSIVRTSGLSKPLITISTQSLLLYKVIMLPLLKLNERIKISGTILVQLNFHGTFKIKLRSKLFYIFRLNPE